MLFLCSQSGQLYDIYYNYLSYLCSMVGSGYFGKCVCSSCSNKQAVSTVNSWFSPLQQRVSTYAFIFIFVKRELSTGVSAAYPIWYKNKRARVWSIQQNSTFQWAGARNQIFQLPKWTPECNLRLFTLSATFIATLSTTFAFHFPNLPAPIFLHVKHASISRRIQALR